jgi:hypothetical protein
VSELVVDVGTLGGDESVDAVVDPAVVVPPEVVDVVEPGSIGDVVAGTDAPVVVGGVVIVGVGVLLRLAVVDGLADGLAEELEDTCEASIDEVEVGASGST